MNFIDYKTKVASKYLPVEPEFILNKIIEAEYYFASIKYDGFFAILEVKDGNCFLYDRNGNQKEIISIKSAASTIGVNVIFAGEICLFKNGRSTNNREVAAALDEPEKYDIRFGVFDIISYKGEDPPSELKEKMALINQLAQSIEVFTIEQRLFESRKDIVSFYKNIANVEEGAVVRSSNGHIYKIKPSVSLDLVVLGYALKPGEDELLRELLLGVITDSGDFLIVAKCSNGFSEDERKEYAEKLKPLAVKSEYTEVSGAKTAFIMVEPTFVIELSCLDIISENNKGQIRKSILGYSKNEGYITKEYGESISCISPVFVRFRDDKQAVSTDVGEHSLSFFIDKSRVDQNLLNENQPSSVLFREVYAKSGKGGTAIRKFLGIQTNKELTGQYPPFLILYTDFSAGRKTPMEQDIYLCSTTKEMESKLAALLEENIKKGWEKV